MNDLTGRILIGIAIAIPFLLLCLSALCDPDPYRNEIRFAKWAARELGYSFSRKLPRKCNGEIVCPVCLNTVSLVYANLMRQDALTVRKNILACEQCEKVFV